MDVVHFISKVEVVDPVANERRFEIEFEQSCDWTANPNKDRHDAVFSVVSDEQDAGEEEFMSRWVLSICKWHLSSSSMSQSTRNPANSGAQNWQQGPRGAGPPGPPPQGPMPPNGPPQQAPPGQAWNYSMFPQFNTFPPNYGQYANVYGGIMGRPAMYGPGPPQMNMNNPNQPGPSGLQQQMQPQAAGPGPSNQPMMQPQGPQQQNPFGFVPAAPLQHNSASPSSQNNSRQLPVACIRLPQNAQAVAYPVLLRLQDRADDLECSVSYAMQVFALGTGRTGDQTLHKTTIALDETRLCGSLNVRPDKFTVRFVISHQMAAPAAKRRRIAIEADHGSILERVVDEQQYGDCILICQQREIKVYKGILAAYSPVFASMFVHDTMEAQSNEVRVDDVDFETLQQMVRFCYSAKEPPAEFAFTLFQVAERYQIEKLKLIVARQISDQITVDNACDVLAMADMHGDEALKQSAKTFIVTNATEIVLGDGYKKLAAERLDLLSEVIVAMANRDASNVVRSSSSHK